MEKIHVEPIENAGRPRHEHPELGIAGPVAGKLGDHPKPLELIDRLVDDRFHTKIDAGLAPDGVDMANDFGDAGVRELAVDELDVGRGQDVHPKRNDQETIGIGRGRRGSFGLGLSGRNGCGFADLGQPGVLATGGLVILPGLGSKDGRAQAGDVGRASDRLGDLAPVSP